MSTNENLTLVINARMDSREVMDMVTKEANRVVKGEIPSLPEELADLFSLEVFTRPSGTKYGVLNFA